MSSVIPASRTTWRPPRSRTCRTRASNQPARARRTAPVRSPGGSVGGPPGPFEQGRSSRANRAGPGRRIVQPEDRESATDVERVERLDRTAATARSPPGHAGRRPPRIDRAELRPDMEVDAARPERAVGTATAFDGVGRPPSRSSRTSSRRRRRPTRPRLGRDVRVQAVQDVQARRRQPARDRGQGGGLLGRLERDPAEGSAVAGGRTAAPQVRRRSCRSPPA